MFDQADGMFDSREVELLSHIRLLERQRDVLQEELRNEQRAAKRLSRRLDEAETIKVLEHDIETLAAQRDELRVKNVELEHEKAHLIRCMRWDAVGTQ